MKLTRIVKIRVNLRRVNFQYLNLYGALISYNKVEEGINDTTNTKESRD